MNLFLKFNTISTWAAILLFLRLKVSSEFDFVVLFLRFPFAIVIFSGDRSTRDNLRKAKVLSEKFMC